MNEYEIVKFEIDDTSLDIRISLDDKTIWLSLNEMCSLFKRDKSVISRHIKNIYKENGFDVKATCAKFARIVAKNATVNNSRKTYYVNCYNLEIILEVGNRIRSKNGLLLKEYLDNYFQSNNQNNLEGNTIIYHNGDISLPVTISPEEETVWLNVNQIAELFDTSAQNIYAHINNIYLEGEIDISVVKDSLVTQKEIAYKSSDGKIYQTLFYNLDVILAVGYRVKSSKAILFRRWANSVLKEYLLKGYVINEKRTLVTNENYINLINRVDNIDHRVIELENSNKIASNKIFFAGDFFEARVFFKELFLKAKKEIILVDPYADVLTLDYLKSKEAGVLVNLYTSFKSKLTIDDIKAFKEKYGDLKLYFDDSFHDRFILIDRNELYHVGTSLNHIGKKTFGINMIEDKDYISSLLDRLDKNR